MLEKMRNLRREKNISLEQLGRMVGKSKQTMSYVERSKIGLDYDLAIDIARILGGTPDEIFLSDKSN